MSAFWSFLFKCYNAICVQTPAEMRRSFSLCIFKFIGAAAIYVGYKCEYAFLQHQFEVDAHYNDHWLH